MNNSELGKINKVDLREIWPNEASDFTPWLEQNISDLGDTLGMELEIKEREAPVGPFSADLLAHDLGKKVLVIIENQLTATDHDHLGKLLTYAAGYDTGVVIWIAREFREEHRQALDWLNNRTDVNTQFFGVVIEVIKIDESRPACNFKLVAFPNEWKKVKAGIRTETTKRGEKYRQFFQKLIDEIREKHNFTKARAGQPMSWYGFSSGFTGIAYVTSYAQGNRVRAEIYIDKGDETLNKNLFDKLYNLKDSLENQFGEALEWERLDEKRASRIAVYRQGNIQDDEETLNEIKKWSIERLLKFKEVFSPKLSELT